MIAFCRKGFLLLVLSILSAAGANTDATLQPPPRPQPNQRAKRPAIFSENQTGVKNLGMAAVNAKWSNYGVYLQRMVETIQRQWDVLIKAEKNHPSSGTQVSVKFTLNSEGTVTSVVRVDGCAAGAPAGAYCISAITKPSPYGKWTDDMIADLGKEQTMTFVFCYE